MKRTVALLLCLCFAFGSFFAVSAETVTEGESNGATVISTVVPDKHTVTVKADGAEVFWQCETVTAFSVDRLSKPKVLIRSKVGKEITKVLLNGEDITSKVFGGYYTFEPVFEDKTLSVITKDTTVTADKKVYKVTGTVKRNGRPLIGVKIELDGATDAVLTDENGRFAFLKVGCGKHSLTVFEDEKVIGFAEFVLKEGRTADFSLSDSGTYNVTVNKNDVGINFVLNINNDGKIEIKQVSGKTGGLFSPKTGDENCFSLWLCFIIFSFISLAIIAMFKKIRTQRR